MGTPHRIMRTRLTGIRRRRGAGPRSEGQALIEFAFTSVIFFTLFLFTINASLIAFDYIKFRNGVSEAARVARMNPQNTAAIQTKMQQFAAPGISNLSVVVTCSGSCQMGLDTAQVQVTSRYTPAFVRPFVGNSGTLSLPFNFTSTVHLW